LRTLLRIEIQTFQDSSQFDEQEPAQPFVERGREAAATQPADLPRRVVHAHAERDPDPTHGGRAILAAPRLRSFALRRIRISQESDGDSDERIAVEELAVAT